MTRDTRQVFEEHLAHADHGRIEQDINENFADDCVLLTSYGRFEGRDGVREAARLLAQQLPNPAFHYTQKSVAGEIAFLEWTGEGDGAQVKDGADSFLVRDGRIRIMTIHYTVEYAAGVNPV